MFLQYYFSKMFKTFYNMSPCITFKVPLHQAPSKFPLSFFYRALKIYLLDCYIALAFLRYFSTPSTKICTCWRSDFFHICLCFPSIQQGVLHNEACNISVVELPKENPLCRLQDLFSDLHLKSLLLFLRTEFARNFL